MKRAKKEQGSSVNSHRQKFTFIEMTIIVVVFIILLSLLLPALKNAREVAYRAECASNLANIGKTFQKHFSDNNGKMPYYNWISGEYIKDAYQCPKDDDPKIMNFYDSDGNLVANVNYSYGFNISTDDCNILRIDNPSEFTTSFDAGDLSSFTPGNSGEVNGRSGRGNNGHGNNEDGIDESNRNAARRAAQLEEQMSSNDDEMRSEGFSTNNPYNNWTVDASGVLPDDTDSWYYQNLKFRHLDTACHLFLDGSVKIEHNPLNLKSLIVNLQ